MSVKQRETDELQLPTVAFNLGFDGRVFLTEDEWATFRRRKPVRYIRKRHDEKCAICGDREQVGNPFQHAHRIGFEVGVIYLALTPDYLDSSDNIVTAHRRTCNQKAELDLRQAMAYLQVHGVDELPLFLPESVRSLWDEIAKHRPKIGIRC